MDDVQKDERFAYALSLAQDLRAITLPAFAHAQNPDNKTPKGGYFDPVTHTDQNAEVFLREKIAARFPDDTIVGEEFPRQDGNSSWSWCLDPIDGTRAFVAGVPVWSTLIGISYNGRPRYGIMDFPALDCQYFGNGENAWRNQGGRVSSIASHPCPDIESAILSCTEPLAMFNSEQRRAYEHVRKRARFSRLGLDAYAYALLAEGRIDIVIEAGLQPYDVHALIPVVCGAGAHISNWQGEDAQNGGAIVCTSDESLGVQVRKALNL